MPPVLNVRCTAEARFAFIEMRNAELATGMAQAGRAATAFVRRRRRQCRTRTAR